MGISQPVRRGEIWHVYLDPTTGHEINKTRPAVIIQNDIGNEFSPITIIAPITSKKTERIYPVEVLIKNSSKVLLNQIRAIDKKRLVKKQGKLTTEELIQVDDALRISLGL